MAETGPSKQKYPEEWPGPSNRLSAAGSKSTISMRASFNYTSRCKGAHGVSSWGVSSKNGWGRGGVMREIGAL
jgi:hypothetical protein